MPDLSQNKGQLNQAALKWLKAAKTPAFPHVLHILSLADWGLNKSVPLECPNRDRPAVEEQVGQLLGWKPENALAWLVNNPNGPRPAEQMHDLLVTLQGADSPESAAAAVLNHIYSRQQAENPALQPAASEPD